MKQNTQKLNTTQKNKKYLLILFQSVKSVGEKKQLTIIQILNYSLWQITKKQQMVMLMITQEQP